MSSKVDELYNSPNFYTKTAEKTPEPEHEVKTTKITKQQEEEFIDRMAFKNRQNKVSQQYAQIIANSPSPFAPKKRTQKNCGK